MNREEKIEWMAVWAAKNNLQLCLEGEVGFGRPCVGVATEGHYPDYIWHNDNWEREDNNGEVWTPADAYHKHPCVAVLGHGEEAEAQLFEWLQWFDQNGFKLETGDRPVDPKLGALAILLSQHRYARMVKQ